VKTFACILLGADGATFVVRVRGEDIGAAFPQLAEKHPWSIGLQLAGMLDEDAGLLDIIGETVPNAGKLPLSGG